MEAQRHGEGVPRPDGAEAVSAEREWFPLVFGVVLVMLAAIFHFVLGPASPGFTYLAVVLVLGGIGALLAAGLKA